MGEMIADNFDGAVERRKTARNSLLDLQKLYRTQLQSLWTTISGSQKFLPLLPGRHLVCEAKNFVELNSATYKVKQNVELFLLNDLLLVAARKRKREDAGRKEEKDWRLVAERCWNLTEVVVVDVKDSGGGAISCVSRRKATVLIELPQRRSH